MADSRLMACHDCLPDRFRYEYSALGIYWKIRLLKSNSPAVIVGLFSYISNYGNGVNEKLTVRSFVVKKFWVNSCG